MKLKILLVPFFLVLAVGLVVWLVMPSYYDDNLKRQDLKNETDRLETATKKTEKVDKLMKDLSANADKQTTLFSFLPEKQQDEEIINDLNNIASSEGVSIANLSLAKSIGAPSVENTTEVKSNISATNFNMDFTIVGAYDKIKNVMDKLARLKRFNKVSALAITKTTTKNEKGEEVAGNNLQAKLTLSFSYLKKADAATINDTIFSQEGFDM